MALPLPRQRHVSATRAGSGPGVRVEHVGRALRVTSRVVPEDIRGGEIKIDWLYQQFHDIPLDAPEAIVRATARAYILFQIGCSLFPNPSGNMVHLKWLLHLEDFDLCGALAWGAAALAHLYRALGNACIRGKVECCCFGTLVQIWAWDHLYIGRPEVVGPQPELVDMPLGCRWNTRLAFRDNVRTTDIEFYRDQLDQQLESQVSVLYSCIESCN
uniref:Aminotransferase-like plant mobile domain-containing protein n=1 Tax=Ananas comosus var. bracteatus TaxID=296719 RepID=A0A6V7QA45_ANACO|nr:unnamed protein product [Ananas comosus var. bracteatus]